jgi:hypothetical protein
MFARQRLSALTRALCRNASTSPDPPTTFVRWRDNLLAASSTSSDLITLERARLLATTLPSRYGQPFNDLKEGSPLLPGDSRE